ncbi:glycine betaine ABC transporter substrate-binding protein [Actinomadura rubrisoli]|uniref:Glycine betaine ABC transporter substrate-binding protein n=1 Tax=Actinomadura rubrisoli TaxID=2530368 RepID=A0A4R4ZMV8_9ACTN|nr:glycine betaine ABC transporter substrate-binding protein [Actinomadura rubrisoli]TDD59600.1 glycine betaine ABC transporter substrate-binding protein [Actinomadura rubrisoli]
MATRLASTRRRPALASGRRSPRLAVGRRIGAALLCPVLLALGACGLKPASAFIPSVEPGSIQPIPGLKDARIRVTSKEFTEQLILGKIAVLALKAAGADPVDHTNAQGSVTFRKSITGGDNDLGWEYTGTGWITYLGREDPIADPQKQFDAVRDLDLKKNRIAWLAPPAPFNNTYAMAVTTAVQKRYNLRDLADMAKVPAPQRTFCLAPEFLARNDGFRGMLSAYGLSYGSSVPAGNVRQMTEGVIYRAVTDNRCTFGEVTTSDGRIQARDLHPLTDSRHFFPNYNPAITVREPVLRAHPELTALFAKISPRLTTNAMRELNSKVDVDGEDPVFVARDWMRDQGLIK